MWQAGSHLYDWLPRATSRGCPAGNIRYMVVQCLATQTSRSESDALGNKNMQCNAAISNNQHQHTLNLDRANSHIGESCFMNLDNMPANHTRVRCIINVLRLFLAGAKGSAMSARNVYTFGRSKWNTLQRLMTPMYKKLAPKIQLDAQSCHLCFFEGYVLPCCSDDTWPFHSLFSQSKHSCAVPSG